MQPVDRDILRQAFRERNRFPSRVSLALKAYAAAGTMMAVIASGYLVSQLVVLSLDPKGRVALAVAVSGVSIAAISITTLYLWREISQRRTERMNDYLVIGRFIQAWAAFENAARSLVGPRDDDGMLSIREMLEALRKKNILQPTDFVRIEELLRVRNAIVHSRMQFPREEIENGYRSLLDYADELERALPPAFVA